MSGFDPKQAFSLSGRTAVVTGGGKGIGQGVALGMARSGARVHVLDRDLKAAEETVGLIVMEGMAAKAHRVDVGDEAEINAAMDAIASEGAIDILVNNAGLAIRKPSVELSVADWDAVLKVNLTGVFLCARAAARHMIANKKGAIVNLASIMGLSGGGLYPNISYQATKGAVVNLTRALAVEWAPFGVRVNAVAPTWVRTDFIKPLTDNPELLARMNAMTPLGRIAEIDEVVGGIVYLASPAAAMVTGHTLAIDGGFLAQ
ncbi:MAG: glucose 1-dehydrogenase [Beijerinckiaceae bacterium]|nr:glucose 1-dehydrogenase [Beijerinckiaceae bacterium]